MPRRINCKPTTQQDEREGGVPWEGTETAGRREMYKEESEVKERGKGRIYKMEEKERKKKKGLPTTIWSQSEGALLSQSGIERKRRRWGRLHAGMQGLCC